MKTQKITFSKMVQDNEGGGDLDIFADGERAGWIEKASSAVDVGTIGTNYRYTVSDYTVTLWTDADTDIPERVFEVSDYATARTALAAAKQWARETLTDALLRSQVADVDTTDAAKACSDLAKDAVEYLASVEPEASYTIHALPSQQVFVSPHKSWSDLTATVEPEAPKTVKAEEMAKPRRADGKYDHWHKCDGCGKPAHPENYCTDYDTADGDDTAGFILCGRKRCGNKHQALEPWDRFMHYSRVMVQTIKTHGAKGMRWPYLDEGSALYTPERKAEFDALMATVEGN